MKKLNLLSTTFVLIFMMLSNTFANEVQVTEKVSEYMTNLKGKKSAVLDNLINDEANFTVINNVIDKVEIIGEDDYFKLVEAGGVCSWASSSQIKSVNVENSIANAYVEYESTKLIRREYLTLVLIDGNWEIVNSVCSLSKK